MQLKSQNLNDSWQLGVGMGFSKFSKSDASFIGDQYLFQTPILSLTMPVGNKFSIDGAIAFNTIDDIGILENSINYFSMDGAVRYNFKPLFTKFAPYAFVGGSIVDAGKKMSPTLNFGAGGIYWITETIGINPQLNYKYSFESYQSMRSHIQGTIGVVFKLNWNNISRGTNGTIKSGAGCI